MAAHDFLEVLCPSVRYDPPRYLRVGYCKLVLPVLLVGTKYLLVHDAELGEEVNEPFGVRRTRQLHDPGLRLSASVTLCSTTLSQSPHHSPEILCTPAPGALVFVRLVHDDKVRVELLELL